MGMSFGHLALLLVIVLVIFGAGRLPQVMGDLGKGLKAFKDGLKENDSSSSISKEEKPIKIITAQSSQEESDKNKEQKI